MRNKVSIVTGPVATGKSTSVMEWAFEQQQAGAAVRGLLNPAVSGKKLFINARTHEEIPMESSNTDPAAIQIGRFNFSRSAFDKANDWISSDCQLNSDIFIFDEIGKLELNEEGLYRGLQHLLDHRRRHRHMIFVIRASLVESAVLRFSLQDAQIVQSLRPVHP